MNLIDIQNKIRSSERHDIANTLKLSKVYVDQVLRGERNNEDVITEAKFLLEYREAYSDWRKMKGLTANGF